MRSILVTLVALVVLSLQGCANNMTQQEKYERWIAKANSPCRSRGYSIVGGDVWCSPKGGVIDAPETLPIFGAPSKEQ